MNKGTIGLVHLGRDVRTCLGFFSRIPAGSDASHRDLEAAAGAWPLTGIMIALGPAILLALALGAGIPPLVAACLALGSAAILTGGLHEDGFADTADGFGGGQERDGKLAIMADSHIGAFGTLALVFSTLLRVGSLAALCVVPLLAVLALLCIAVLSRTLAVWHWSVLSPAKSDGLAATIGHPGTGAKRLSIVSGGIAFLILAVAFGGAGFFAGTLAFLCIVAFNRLCRHQISGHTGDTIGAAQLIGEIALFAGLSTSAVAVVLP
ncbi:MAG: adenosylcobinamide-GDP ribazoletransferase [Alphaproteobacteria bacterium]